MWFVSFLCLSFVALACVAAVLAKVFRENWPQHIALSMVCLGAVSRAAEVLVVQYVPPQEFALYVGLALYAAGTWYKFGRFAMAGRIDRADRAALATMKGPSA